MPRKKLLFTLTIALLFLTNNVLAQGTTPNNPPATPGDLYGLNTTAQQAGLPTQAAPTVSQIIGMIINAVLGLVGVIFLILIIYSGFQWMTAGGNEETIAHAKKRLTNATIGLVIVLTAYVISLFILTSIWYDVLFSNP